MNRTRQRIQNHPQLKVAFSLIRQEKYLDAYDRFLACLQTIPLLFPDILSSLYQELSKNIENTKLKLIIAELYLHKRKYEQAYEELEEIIWITPTNTQPYFLLSKYFKQFSKQQKIQTVFEKAFHEGIRDSSIIETLTNLYMTQKNTEKGIPFYKKLCDETNKLQHIKALAHFYKLENNFDKAAETFDKILTVSPSDIPNLMIDCETLLKRCPDNQKLHELLVNLYTQACLPEKATLILQDMFLFNLINQNELLKQYKKLLNIFPNHLMIMVAYTESLIKNDHFTEALDQLRTLFDKHQHYDLSMINLIQDILIKVPNNHLALVLLLDIQMAKKQYPDAILTIQKAINSPIESLQKLETHITHIRLATPKHTIQCQIALSQILAKKGRIKEALCELEKIHHCPEELNCRLLSIQLCYDNNLITEAKEKLRAALKYFPYNPDIHHHAQRLFKKSIQNEKELLNKQEKLSQKLLLKKGLLYLCEESLEEALSEFQKIESPHAEFSQAQLLIARCFMELSRYDLAIHRLQPYLKLLKPNSVKLKNKIRYLLSINHACMGHYDEALSYLDEILAFDIHFPYIKSQIEALKKRGKNIANGHMITASIMPSCKPLLTVTSQNQPTLHLNQNSPSFATNQHESGIKSLFKHDLNTAEQAFKLAIELNPNFYESHINLATIYCIWGNYKTAWEHIIIVEKAHPKLNTVYLAKGLYYIYQSQFKKALKHYKVALELHPNDALAMLAIGDCYYLQKDFMTAFRYWSSALKKGSYFHLIHRRWCYLNPKPTAPYSWTEDITLDDFNPMAQENPTQLHLSLHSTGPLFDDT